MGLYDHCGQFLMVEESEVPSGGVGGMRGKRRKLTFDEHLLYARLVLLQNGQLNFPGGGRESS